MKLNKEKVSISINNIFMMENRPMIKKWARILTSKNDD
jgi:hypothetical protein